MHERVPLGRRFVASTESFTFKVANNLRNVVITHFAAPAQLTVFIGLCEKKNQLYISSAVFNGAVFLSISRLRVKRDDDDDA